MPFSTQQTVRSMECDATDHLTIKALARYFQDIAEAQASSLDNGYDALIQQGKAWVICRMYLQIIQMPKLLDSVMLNTWPRKNTGLFAVRDYELCNDGGHVIVSGTAYWAVINFQTRRVERFHDGMMERYMLESRQASDKDTLDKLRHPGFADSDIVAKIVAEPSFIDHTHHVNNAEYLRIISDYLPFDSFNVSNLGVQIDYIQETAQGDTLSVFRKQDGNTTWFQISNSQGVSVVAKVNQLNLIAI